MQFSNAVQQNLDSALSIPFVSSAVALGLAFYGYKAAPELPSFVEEMFLNVFFQIFVGFMVLYMTTQNVMLSLVVSAVFIYGMKMLSNVKEGMFGGDTDKFNSYNNEQLTQKTMMIQNSKDLIDFLTVVITEIRDAGYSTKADEFQSTLYNINKGINKIDPRITQKIFNKLIEEMQAFINDPYY